MAVRLLEAWSQVTFKKPERERRYNSASATSKYVVSKIRYLPNCYRIVVQYGFMDENISPDLVALVFRRLRNYVINENASTSIDRDSFPKLAYSVSTATKANNASNSETGMAAEEIDDVLDLAQLQRAYDHLVLYIIGREEMMVKPGTPIWL